MQVFLVCDRDEEVTHYQVERNGVVEEEEEVPDGSGYFGLKHEVTGIEGGAHEFRVKACSVVGCSEWSEVCEYVKEEVPQVPMKLRIVTEAE